MTQKESGKIRSLYLKEGLHLLLGRGLGMKSPTRIKKTYFANYTADPTTDSFTPAQESCQTVQREFKESHTSTVDYLKQTPGSDVARGSPYSKEPQRWLTASVAMYIFPFYINYLRCSYLHKTIFINLIYRKCIVIWI